MAGRQWDALKAAHSPSLALLGRREAPPDEGAGSSLASGSSSAATASTWEEQRARLQEACCINRSLSALSLVIYSLNTARPHIPYRDSKLTMLLRDSLGGSARTWMGARARAANTRRCPLPHATRGCSPSMKTDARLATAQWPISRRSMHGRARR